MTTPSRTLARALGALLLAASLVPASAGADDRDLLRNTQDAPYVFILFDVSGSMNWQPAGDAWAPASADDPSSKFYQAKSGIFRALQATDDINFGFATFDQDGMQVIYKHFLYRLLDGQEVLPWVTDASTQLDWPTTSEPITFGPQAGIDGTDNALGACGSGPNLTQTGNNLLEALGEFNRFPKLGWAGTPVTTTIWFIHRVAGGNYRFRMDFTLIGNATAPLGSDNITVRMRLQRFGTSNTCTTGSGGTRTYDSGNHDRVFTRYYVADNRGIPFTGSSDFIIWERDADVGPGGVPAGFFSVTSQNPQASGTCDGWEPNTDTATDTNGINLKQVTVADPLGRSCGGCLNRGDVIPLDWSEDSWLGHANAAVAYNNRDLILTRLAPNLISEGLGARPDFRQGRYFQHTQSSGRLTLRNGSQKPLIASGSTPIGASMANFRDWFDAWRQVAAAEDPRFGCKKVTLLIITDGDETCGGNPATIAGQLLNRDIETYVIGFGLPLGGGNTLVATTCAGGGQAPGGVTCTTSPTNDHLFLPNSEDELVDALASTFSAIKETASAFASAAAPTLQANVEDKVIISSFTPLDNESTWAARLDAYLKPVPTTGDGKPDKDRVCAPGDTAECLLWDAGDSQPDVPGGSSYQPTGLLLQAPLENEIDVGDPTTLRLGLGADQRRFFYSQFDAALPGGTIWVSSPGAGNRQLFTFPTTDQNKRDLWEGMEIPFVPGDTDSETAAYDLLEKVIVKTLAEKQAQITDPFTNVTSDITYLLGDIFHSNPIVVDQPGRFDYYTGDPYVSKRLCNQDPDPTRSPAVSYKWFADRHLCRRKMLFVGSNDGQLHAFDAGIFEGPDCKLPTTEDRDGDGQPDGDGDPIEGAFTNGTGKELFAFVPRQMLPHLRQLAETTDQDWGLDNSVRVDDVFIDPAGATAGAVTCLDREWRTVLIGSYREGGSGYFALDITQPDVIASATNVPQPVNDYVPSCTDGPAACGSRPFPSVLWEFTDSVPGNPLARMDEDLNGWPDLANTWSVPATGRIRVCDADCSEDSVEDRFVAVFGGGLGDPPTRPHGNYVYMVDIETGRVLWKHAVQGAVPGDVATVSGGDGYLKTLYFGTTAGRVYKVILESGPMRLIDVNVDTLVGGSTVTVQTQRIAGPVGDVGRYDPFTVFVTNGTPIYHEIGAIYVQQRQATALAFGTGNRWNLWDDNGQEGRFYMILDTGFVDNDRDGTVDPPCGGCPTPLTEASYQMIAPDTNPGDLSGYLVDPSDPTPGWWIRLDTNERLISEAFALSGITIFISFAPDEIENPDGTCSRTGESRLFIVGTLSGAGYWFPDPDNTNLRQRYFTSTSFHSAPFVERGATGNQGGGGSNADRLTPSLEMVKEELKRLFPANCRFGNYTQNVKSLRQDTRIVFVAPVPICIEPTNFKEF